MGVSTDCGTRFIAVGWLGFTNNATRWLYASIVYHMEFGGCGFVSAFSHGRVALEYGYRTWKNRRISRCLLSLFSDFSHRMFDLAWSVSCKCHWLAI